MSNSSSLSKRRRNVLSLKDKLDIVAALKSGVTRSKVAEKYDIGLSTVADICKREHEFREFASSTDPSRRVMRKSANDEMDDAVYMWYQLMRMSNQTVSGSQLCEKALAFNRKLNGDATFKASHGWLQRFKTRRGITFEQKKIEDDECVGEPRLMMSDEEILRRCLVAVKSEGGGAAEGGCDGGEEGADGQDAYLDSETGFIRRKKRRRRSIAKLKPKRTSDSLEEMKKRKLALQIEQLELRNHLCRLEIFQAEKQHSLEPSVYTESLYSGMPITEVYLDNLDAPQ